MAKLSSKEQAHSVEDAEADERVAQKAAKVAVHKHEGNMHRGESKTKLPPHGYGR